MRISQCLFRSMLGSQTNQRKILLWYIADEFISIPCTFDSSAFICGYVSTKLGEWKWSLKTGKDNNPLTGPESDARGNLYGSF